MGLKRLIVGLALGLALEACLGPSSPGPISQSSAVNAAMANADGKDVHVRSTRLSTYGNVTGSGAAVDANTPVWVVVLSGTFTAPACGGTPAPTPRPCGPPVTTARVLIDARTGAFIRSDLPAPPGG